MNVDKHVQPILNKYLNQKEAINKINKKLFRIILKEVLEKYNNDTKINEEN